MELLLQKPHDFKTIFNRSLAESDCCMVRSERATNLLAGATPLEDMINYNTIVRGLTEWTANNTHFNMDQSTVADGIGGISMAGDDTVSFGIVPVRQKYIQGVSKVLGTGVNFYSGTSLGNVPQSSEIPAGLPAAPAGVIAVTRRYQINFALGLFTQDKLIPTKFMVRRSETTTNLFAGISARYRIDFGTISRMYLFMSI